MNGWTALLVQRQRERVARDDPRPSFEDDVDPPVARSAGPSLLAAAVFVVSGLAAAVLLVFAEVAHDGGSGRFEPQSRSASSVPGRSSSAT